MIRAIIVDDEILARIGIRSFIDGVDEITVTGIFGSASEAMGYLRSHSVDIIITDIEMTGLSGLDFIKSIREEGFDGGVIIVSCHDEFSYAQQAIAQGTDAYLLKINLDQDTLVNEIKRVYELRSIQRREVKEDKTEPAAESVEMLNGIYQVAVIRLRNETDGWDVSKQESHIIIDLLEEIVNHYQMGTLFTPYNRESFLLLSYSGEESEETINKIAEKNVQILSKNLSQYLNEAVYIGLSQTYTSLQETREHFSQAVAASKMKFYARDEIYCSFSDMNQNVQFTGVPFSLQEFLADPYILLGEISKMCEKAANAYVPVDRFRRQMSKMLNEMTYEFMKDSFFREQLCDVWEQEIANTHQLNETAFLPEFMDRMQKGIEHFSRQLFSMSWDECMQNVTAYIEKNLEKELALPELAAQAGMSVPSFCRHFKEYTQMTTTQYINERRIRMAETMLLTGSHSLGEVALTCGFSNENYLIRVFKKVTGQTISEYREKNRKSC